VILLHGITTHRDEYASFFVRIADSLSANGISSLRLDFRGHGESTASTREFSVASQVLDTISAIDWWNARESTPLHLLGCSFGAPPAIFAATLRKSAVVSLILVCPVLDYKRTFLQPTTEWASEIFNARALDRAYRSGSLSMSEGFEIDVKLLVEMELIEPAKALQGLRIPTLLIHGEMDSMVPVFLSAEIAAPLDHVDLLVVPRMDHGFMDIDDEFGTGDTSKKNLDLIVNSTLRQIGRSS
jgi:pimeloyl-ACP methyl ester carboxylesterase